MCGKRDVVDAVGAAAGERGGHAAEAVAEQQAFQILRRHLRLGENQGNFHRVAVIRRVPKALRRIPVKVDADDLVHDFTGFRIIIGIRRLGIDALIKLIQIQLGFGGDFTFVGKAAVIARLQRFHNARGERIRVDLKVLRALDNGDAVLANGQVGA